MSFVLDENRVNVKSSNLVALCGQSFQPTLHQTLTFSRNTKLSIFSFFQLQRHSTDWQQSKVEDNRKGQIKGRGTQTPNLEHFDLHRGSG